MGTADSSASPAGEFREACEVTLKQINPRAPFFHRHIVRTKLVGGVCKIGDKVVVYEVVATDPDGVVAVSERTILRFV